MLMYFFLLLNIQHLVTLGSSESPIPEDSVTEPFVFQDIDHLLLRDCRVAWDEARWPANDLPIFVPLSCSRRRPLVRQKAEDAEFARRMTTIAATRVAEEEFTVCSASVAQRLEEKLQIAEVESEAKALAISLARPGGIEDAWIGGYLEGATWTWLPSANEVHQETGSWRNGSKNSLGCLMLDRHACGTPVHLDAKCDRDTLALLDSERTVKQMTKLMLQNRNELKDAWTDGRRRSSPPRDSHQRLWRREWLRGSTQEPFPRAEESFIPWRSTEKYSNGTECFNLDREDHDSPIVYGLDCSQNQTHVCQPLSGPCVSHEIGSSSIDDNISSPVPSSPIETTASEVLHPCRSKSSQTPIAALRENTDDANAFRITSTLASSKPYPNVQGFARLPSSGVWQQVNQSSQNNSKVNIERVSDNNVGAIYEAGLADFLRPYFQLSLPSLPQFGMKLVSAQTADAFSILTEKPHESTDKITEAPFDVSPSGQSSTTAKSTTISLLASTALPDADFEISRKSLDLVTRSSAEHTSSTEGDSKRRRTDKDSGIETKLANSSFNTEAFKSTTLAQKKPIANSYQGETRLPLLERTVYEESKETYLPHLSILSMNFESTTVSATPAVAAINTNSSSMPSISPRMMQNVTTEKHSNGDSVLSTESEFQHATSSSRSVESANSVVPDNRWHYEQINQSDAYDSTEVPAGPTTPKKLSSMSTLTNWTTDTLSASSQSIDYQRQTILRSSPTSPRSTSSSASSTVTNSVDVRTKADSIDGTVDWKSDTDVAFQKKVTESTNSPLEATNSKTIGLEHENTEDGGTVSWEGYGSPDKKKKGNKLENPFEIHDDAVNSQREEEEEEEEEEKEEDENYLDDDEPESIGPSAVTKSYIRTTGGTRKSFKGVTEFVHGKVTENQDYKVEEKLLHHAKSSDDIFKKANNRRVEETTVPQGRRINVNTFSLRPYYVLERPLSLDFSSNGGSDETRILPVNGARYETATSTVDKGPASGEDGRTEHCAFSKSSESKSTNVDISNIWDLVKSVKIDLNANALSKFLERHNIGQSNENGENNVSRNEFPLFPNALNSMGEFKIDFNGNPIRVRIKTSPPDGPAALSESTELNRANRNTTDDNTGSSNFLQLFLRADKNPKNFQKSSNLLSNFSKNLNLASDSLTRTADLYWNIDSYSPFSSDAYTRPITEPESNRLNSPKNKSLLEKFIDRRNESDDFYYDIFESMMNTGQAIGLNRKRYILYLVLRQLIDMTEADLKLYHSATFTSNGSLARDSLIDFQKRLLQVVGQWKNRKSILPQRSLVDGTDSSNRNANENSPSPIDEKKISTLFIRASLGLEKISRNKKP